MGAGALARVLGNLVNTNFRTNAKNSFEKDFYKLMNNSVYGKTMENVAKRVDIRLVNNEKSARKLINKPQYKTCHVINDNLLMIEMLKTEVKLDKPIYLGFCILEHSKRLMYDFFYRILKPMYRAGAAPRGEVVQA